jgi:hypothetical protein
MTDALNEFELSLQRDEPAPTATPLLRALWHGLRGEWTEAHENPWSCSSRTHAVS